MNSQQVIQLGDMEVQTDLVVTPTVLVGTCANCKHWDTRWETVEGKHICRMMSDEATVVIYVNSYEPAEIHTPPTFACNQWEA